MPTIGIELKVLTHSLHSVPYSWPMLLVSRIMQMVELHSKLVFARLEKHRMAFLPFRLSDLRIQFLHSLCQFLRINQRQRTLTARPVVTVTESIRLHTALKPLPSIFDGSSTYCKPVVRAFKSQYVHFLNNCIDSSISGTRSFFIKHMVFASTLRILCSFIGSISIGKINSINSSMSFNFKNNLSS